jgi:hypothetical protein
MSAEEFHHGLKIDDSGPIFQPLEEKPIARVRWKA